MFRFFHAIGVTLKQIYGQTEISGISCIHRDGDIAFHTVGEPIPGTELRIAEEGEILSRSPSVFLGYYKNRGHARRRSPAVGSTPATPAISPTTASSS